MARLISRVIISRILIPDSNISDSNIHDSSQDLINKQVSDFLKENKLIFLENSDFNDLQKLIRQIEAISKATTPIQNIDGDYAAIEVMGKINNYIKSINTYLEKNKDWFFYKKDFINS